MGVSLYLNKLIVILFDRNSIAWFSNNNYYELILYTCAIQMVKKILPLNTALYISWYSSYV